MTTATILTTMAALPPLSLVLPWSSLVLVPPMSMVLVSPSKMVAKPPTMIAAAPATMTAAALMTVAAPPRPPMTMAALLPLLFVLPHCLY